MRQLKIASKITNRESVSLERYLSEVNKIPLLSGEEEVELMALVKEGDEEALAKLTRSNLRFVISVAKQYQNMGLSLSDLINEGNIGLMRAVRRFDSSRGFKFITYAVWWIRQSILQAIVEYSRIIRVPANKIASYNKLMKEYNSFLQENKRKPSISELVELMDMPHDQVMVLLRVGNKHLSLDSPVSNEDNETTMLDLYVDEDFAKTDEKLISESVRKEVLSKLSILSPKEKEVLKLLYGLNGQESLNLYEIAQRLGVSKERARQVKERAIRKLRISYQKTLLSN